jgi:putative FmdB family regulatory protein
MPIYEYECSLCHHRFERRQRFDAEPVAICPKCQGKSRRVIHSVPIIFKGSGFHVTDHRNPSPREKGVEATPDKNEGK